jgi:cytochrome b involved in lipid metabolism
MNKTALFTLLTSSLFLVSCTGQPQNSAGTGSFQSTENTAPSTAVTPATEVMSDQKSYTLDEVALHNTKEDCWMVLSGKVYDVTAMVDRHPGGDTLVEGCGKDATEMFETRPMGSQTPHSQKARDMAKNIEIGVLAQ